MGESVLMPVMAMIIVFGTPVAIVIAVLVANHKTKKKRYDAMVKAIELGKNPDEIKELFQIEEKRTKKNGSGFLKGGIIVAGIGFGLLGMSTVLGEPEVNAPGVFMLILGLAFIVVYLFTKPKAKTEEETK